MNSERLYEQLPAVLRGRDADQAEPLRALAAVLQRVWDELEADIETTWDNWFIETCEEWLVPYIGETLGVRGLRAVESAEFSLRSYVANTLARRRRKGTAAATEQLARDVTGYPARVAELFQHTLVSLNVDHVRRAADRPSLAGTIDLRDTRALEHLGGAFDRFAHSADVRSMETGEVHHNLPNLALHLWRVRSWELSGVSARRFAGPDGWFRFDPLGHDIGLFTLPRGEDDITALAQPEHVPHPLTRLELRTLVGDDTDDPPAVPLPDPPVVVRLHDGPEPRVMKVTVCNLADVSPTGDLPTRRPEPGVVAVDPVLGRMVFDEADVPAAPADAPDVTVDYSYGLAGRLGAGPYDRSDLLAAQLRAGDPGAASDDDLAAALESLDWHHGVSATDTVAIAEVHPTLEDAVVAWNAFVAGLAPEARRDAVGLITIHDSRSYPAPTTTIELPDGAKLLVVAAPWQLSATEAGVPTRRTGDILATGTRPHVHGDLAVVGSGTSSAVRAGGLFLDGLLLEGAVVVEPGDLEQLDLAACTLAPLAGPSIIVGSAPEDSNASLQVRLRRCIAGAVSAAEPVARVELADSFLRSSEPDGTDGFVLDLGGGAVDIRASTTIGGIRCATLDASDALLAEGEVPGPESLRIAQPQAGCLRFSYVPAGGITPRRHRCQPDLALEGVTDAAERARIVRRVRPVFAGEELGDPALGLLHPRGPHELRTASSDADEPGVWHHLHHATRIANLRAALRQYLRFGLEAGVLLDR